MTSIATRACGPARFPVPALGFGSFHTWERAVFEDIVILLRRAVEAGGLMLDVAVYRHDFIPGWSDRDSPTDLILSRALQVAGIGRDQYTLCAKAWFPPTQEISLTRQMDELLLRHGSDHADVLITESIDIPEAFDMGSVIAEIGALITDGRIRHWAVNNWSAAQVREAFRLAGDLGVPPPQFGQMKYGLAHRTVVEGESFARMCEQTGFSVQASRALGGGLLTGRDGMRHPSSRLDWLDERAGALAGRLAEVAADFGATPAQFAIAFALANPIVATVLIGARTAAQAVDAMGAFEVLERHDPSDLRAAADEFWIDRDRVDPESGGGPGSELSA